MAACSRTSTASTAGVSRLPNRPWRSSVPEATAQDDPQVTPPRRAAPVSPNPARSPKRAPGVTLRTASAATRLRAGTVVAAARRSAPSWSSPTAKSRTTTAISAAARVIAGSGRRAWSGPTADTTRPTSTGTGQGSKPWRAASRVPAPRAASTTPRPRSVPASRLPEANISGFEELDQGLDPVRRSHHERRVARLEAEVGPGGREGGVLPQHGDDRHAGDRTHPGGGNAPPGVRRPGRHRHPVDREPPDRMAPPGPGGRIGFGLPGAEQDGQGGALRRREGDRFAGGVGVDPVVDENVAPPEAVGHDTDAGAGPRGHFVADADTGQRRFVDLGHGPKSPRSVPGGPPGVVDRILANRMAGCAR